MSPQPAAHPAPALGAFVRLAWAVVGLVLGTVVGCMLFGVSIGIAAEVLGSRVDRVWALRTGCATGAIAAFAAAAVDTRAWHTWSARPRRPLRARSHGWADAAFRSALGLVVGFFAGGLLAGTAIAWLLAFGYQPSRSALGIELDLFVITALAALAGAPLGAIWFAADLPVLPGRRRAPRS